MTNRLFEKFDILECLKSDVATVYIAHHVYLEKDILLKTLDTRSISDPLLLKRFQREAKMLAQLEHENVIKVLDFGTYQEFFYISFEYFQSCTLRDLLKDGALKYQAADSVFKQVCSGMQYAHAHHIIHRDLKPENILIDAAGHVKIADFGLALVHDDPRMTMQSGIVGTPGYMSPEQIRGEELDPRSDIFSLGIVACEMLTGHNPFLGRDVGQTLNHILSFKDAHELSQDLPEPYANIVAAMLQPNRKKRIASIPDILTELGVSKQQAVNKVSIQLEKKRWRWFAAALVAILFIIVLFPRKIEIVPPHHAKSTTVDDSARVSAIDKNEPVVPQKNEQHIEPFIAEGHSGKDKAQQEIIEMGGLIVRCLPWARINIDDQFVDTTPIDDAIRLQSGVHTVTFKHSDYPAYTKNIRIHPNKTETIAVNLDTLFGFLQVNVYPWAEIEIDGENIGKTPLQNPVPLVPGQHVLVAKNQHYTEYSKQIVIEKKDTLTFRLNFENILQ